MAASLSSQNILRFGVIGAGFAGLAVTYHLLLRCSQQKLKADVEVFDMSGIGGGASGAAAGLLHSHSVSGKLMWNGEAAMKAAEEMITAAESIESDGRIVCLRKGLLFEARSEKQRNSFLEVTDSSHVVKITRAEAHRHLPGLVRQGGTNDDDFYGLFIPNGCVIDPVRYMNNIWLVCQRLAEDSDDDLSVSLSKENVTSCAQLESDRGSFDAIVVAAGAAIGCIEELKDKLPLRLCQGATLMMRLDEGQEFDGPSLLGNIYLASQSPTCIVIGATYTYDLTPEQARTELQSNSNHSWSHSYLTSTSSYLHNSASAIWEPLSEWKSLQFRTGVRAMAPMTHLGSVPLMRFLQPNVWVVTGLGARGLLYHAWLGATITKAILEGERTNIPSL